MSDVVVLKVDVDDCEDVAAEYKVVIINNSPTETYGKFVSQITAMPTFIFFKNKAKVADLTGANVGKLCQVWLFGSCICIKIDGGERTFGH